MNFLKKLKSSNFWVSMISAVILILQAVFNVDIKTEYLNQIILGILGLLVMSGIVTDTNTNEMTVKQTLDLDSVKESISNMFAQIGATLQTDITNIVSQFENPNLTQNTTSNEIQNEVTQTQNVITEIQNGVTQTQNVITEIKNEVVKPQVVAEVKEVTNETQNEVIVGTPNIVNETIIETEVVEENKQTEATSIQTIVQEINVPKNEL